MTILAERTQGRLMNASVDDLKITEYSRQELSLIYDVDLAREEGYSYIKNVSERLYFIGSRLINSGRAYRELNNNQSSTNELMSFYQRLPQYINDDGIELNPLHAVFILAVCLDHLPVKETLKLYKKLNQYTHELKQCKSRPLQVAFPNGSKFLDIQAIAQIVTLYVKENEERFKQYPGYSSIEIELFETSSEALHHAFRPTFSTMNVEEHVDVLLQSLTPRETYLSLVVEEDGLVEIALDDAVCHNRYFASLFSPLPKERVGKRTKAKSRGEDCRIS